MASDRGWVVTPSGGQPLPDVARRLKKAGFKVDGVLEAIGCITGTASEEVAERLRALPGVADVSPAPPSVDVGPPNSSDTW